MNELVSNIFKHAFPNINQGKISIRLFKDDDSIINLQLGDNGVGLPNNFDIRKDGSMGLSSVFSLVERQLKGSISAKSGNGLKWHIKINDNLHQERV
jgi:two-component sensor histidine kinase